jgi:hypothetical protein
MLSVRASAFESVNVEMVDDQDVIEGFLQAREEAGAGRLEFGLGQLLASGQKAMVRPGIVVGEGPVGLKDVGCLHRRSPRDVKL